jgi:hypothetical protein
MLPADLGELLADAQHYQGHAKTQDSAVTEFRTNTSPG